MRSVLRLSAISLVVACVPYAAANADAWSAKIGGRVMIDYTHADADTADFDISASALRRARLNVSGAYGKILKYKFELNTNSSGEINAEDAYLEWKPEQFGGWAIKAGQFKTPNSFDEANSSRFMSTLERAGFTDAFQLNRRVGLTLGNKGDNWTFSGGVFGENLEDVGDQEGYAMAARGTYVPMKTETSLLHVGASIRYREAGESSGDIRYRQRAYAHIPGRIISTGAIAQSDTMIGIEAVGMTGPAWVAAEYAVTSADSSDAIGADQDMQGYYMEAGYFFGGRRNYKSGKFDRPSVDAPITEGGLGAVSVVARFDDLDLADTRDGGELTTVVLGVDWWPTDHTRVGLNYFNSDADLGTSTSGLDSAFSTLVASGQTNDTVNGVTMRLFFDF